jgi:hypothetical protein
VVSCTPSTVRVRLPVEYVKCMPSRCQFPSNAPVVEADVNEVPAAAPASLADEGVKPRLNNSNVVGVPNVMKYVLNPEDVSVSLTHAEMETADVGKVENGVTVAQNTLRSHELSLDSSDCKWSTKK